MSAAEISRAFDTGGDTACEELLEEMDRHWWGRVWWRITGARRLVAILRRAIAESAEERR